MPELDFPSLYERYSLDVYRFALYLSGDRAQAEDVAAETFARAWVARDQIRVGTVKAYLLTIARNLCRDGARQKRAARALPPEPALADPAPDPEAAAHARGHWAAVLKALRELTELDRAVLLMTGVEGLPHEAVGAALGLSVPAVKVRVHRARLRLKAILGQGGPGP